MKTWLEYVAIVTIITWILLVYLLLLWTIYYNYITTREEVNMYRFHTVTWPTLLRV